MIAIRNTIKIKSPKKSRVFIAKGAWECIGGSRYYFRSLLEVRVATYLQSIQESLQINSWEYEPQTFWFEGIKRGVRSYKPDFKVTSLDGSHYWVEVKGYMDSKSKTKLKRFKKYYPKEQLIVITKDNWYGSFVIQKENSEKI
jgi:Protein of unknown function (DUF1064)